jgi:hypothetical protein
MSLKKRSSTNQPLDIVFFTDRDLGHTLPDALARAGASVERHDKHFEPTTPDPEWIRFVGERGWIALSHNTRIRYVTDQRDMVMRANVGLFLLVGRGYDRLTDTAVRTLPTIRKFCASHARPFIAKVHGPDPVHLKHNPNAPGRVELWLSRSEWLTFPGV